MYVARHYRRYMWLCLEHVEQSIRVLQTALESPEGVGAFNDETLVPGAFVVIIARIDIVMKHDDRWFVGFRVKNLLKPTQLFVTKYPWSFYRAVWHMHGKRIKKYEISVSGFQYRNMTLF